MTPLLDFVGKFHPLLLHIPIGVFVYCYLQWAYDAFFKKEKSKKVDLTFALGVGVVSAIGSAISGYLLARGGGYDETLLDWHQYLGIGTAIAAIFTATAYRKNPSGRSFGLILSAFMILLMATGHYGGSLTHGKDFLSFKSTQKEEVILTDIQQAHLFDDIVMPIVNRKCVSCHNPEKSKGGLLLHDLEAWRKGGESGPLLVAGDLAGSLFSQRIHLPKTEEEHMPPDGKLQLTADEMDFLDWWVAHRKDYSHTVEELAPDAKIMAYLQSLRNDPTKDLPELDAAQIAAFNRNGFSVVPFAKNSKWLDVSFPNKKQVSKNDLKELSAIATNIRQLNLSNKGITDEGLKIIKRFKNLLSLNLSKNPISDQGIKFLKKLPQLKSLNLYGTNVSPESLKDISAISTLEKVYLWQTKITAEHLEKYQSNDSRMAFDMGIDESAFGSPQLVAPIIDAEQELFEDSLLVEIKSNAKLGRVYYTLDGSLPDTNAFRYRAPFPIYESTTIKTFLAKKGWQASEIVDKTFIKARYKVQDVVLNKPPNEKYAAQGPQTLIDFTKASESFDDGKWIAYQQSGVTATLDLGEVVPVSGVSIGALLDYRSYIFLPIGFDIESSTDGKTYRPYTQASYEPLSKPQENEITNFLFKTSPTSARYLKIKIKSPLVNPDWHSAPGAPCWIFLDEILVE